ncbi:hypothetical protein LTR56_019404 [Elasticomyces elasticus]|nr:hypothetical protein LTR22_023430 [Elasticomyces elasticus]KAK3627080.1 hypothetical protein LTR56_019404 [Elasticomyces elasticus]KAK4904712.1 hypothetical protein LTR49_025883 [Elasticomyces elasticus]KAK5746520.1 hypothetical protein LTS12_022703 [Elasticomyces elasticus]
MENTKESSDSGQGQKNDKKRKAEEAADYNPFDLAQTMFSKKSRETSAGTLTISEAMEQAAARYRDAQKFRQGNLNSVADMAQATAKKVKQTNADTSAPAAAVQGGTESDYRISLYSAIAAYQLSGKEAAAAYLRGYSERGLITTVSAVSSVSGRAKWDLANQRYHRLAAGLDDGDMDVKNDAIVGWAHGNAKKALRLLMPNQPDKVRHAMGQLIRYAPVSMES